VIKVYSSKFSASPTETYEHGSITLGDWLAANVKSYVRNSVVPISVSVDGVLVPQVIWHDKLLDAKSDVRITVEPKGTELFIGALFLAATRMMSPKIPKMNNLTSTQGKELDSPAAKGNKVKVNDARPELAGTYKIYGNYLKPMIRRFRGKRDQRVTMVLDLGIGNIDLQASDIHIGETPITSYGDNASWSVYRNGAPLSAEHAEWWHDVQEVGSGSDGSSGLAMTESEEITSSYVAYSHKFNGKSISIPSGSGSFPADWKPGMLIRVVAPYPYTVIEDATADIIQGKNLAMLNASVGMQIEIEGANSGFYVVRSHTPPAPAVAPTPGSAGYAQGSNSPSTFNFSGASNSETFTVKVGTTNYPVTINTDTVNMAGLITAINNAKGSAPFEAVNQSGVVRVRDTLTPYTGRAVTVTGGSRIFGASPSAVAGVAATSGTPEVIEAITLNMPDGSPSRTLVTGGQMMAIEPRGMRFKTVTAATQMLTVQRMIGGVEDTAWSGFVDMETTGAVITLDISNFKGGYRGPFAACPADAKVDMIEWDVFHPQGLCGIGRQGQIYDVRSFHTFEWRDADIAGPWNEEFVEHYGGSRDAMGFTYRVALPYPMRAEVRIVKRFVSQPGRIDDEKQDDIVWYGCRARVPGGATSYPNSTVLVVNLRGGDQLAADSENKVWVRGTRVIPVRINGAWAAAQPTDDIEAYCLHVLKSAGYTDDQLDLAEWDRLGDVWRSRGDTFNWLFKDQQTVQQVVEKALACGFSEMTVKNGLLTPVRDEPQEVFQALYTYDTQTDDGALDIRFDVPSGDDIDGIDIRYMDHKLWQLATAKCRIPGAPAAKRVKVIEVEGISTKDKAYQYGMRELLKIKYQRKTCSWSTEMSAFNSNYMDLVQVAGECPGYAQSTVMEAYGGHALMTVEVDQDIAWDDFTPPYLASVRRMDGKCFGPVKITRTGARTFTLPKPLDFEPDFSGQGVEPPYVLIGQGYGVQITDIKPDGTDAADVEAKFYTPEIYAFDDAVYPD